MPRAGRVTAFLLFVALGAAGCREEGDIRISSLNFEGIEQVDKGALTNALVTRKGSWLPWGRKRYFDRSAFEADLKRIQAFYADRGFPDARIRSFDVKLNDAQNEVDVTVVISEGEPIRVAAVDLVGFDVLNEAQMRGLRDGLPLQAERPLDRQLALSSRERALNTLRDNGYPYAEVEIRQEEAGTRRQRIVLQATPGALSHFGEVEIAGAASVGDHVIERQLTFKPGDRFTRKAMRDSQRKLYGLELFQFANVQSLENREQMSATVPVRVTVAEGKHRRLTTAFGYGSEEKARARIRWDHLNFFGGARHAGFEGRWSSLDRGVRVDYTEPYVFRKNYSLRLEGQAWQAAEPVYSQNIVGGRVILRRQASSEFSWSVSLINEFQRSTVTDEALTDFTIRDELIALGLDPRGGEFGTTEGTVGAIAFDLNRNTADSVLDARRGYFINAHLEQAGRWLWGSYKYWSASAEGRHYLSVGPIVFANRAEFGSIDPTGDVDANVPFHKRYFLGGATSIRGWGRFEVSPLSGSGFPIGGLSLFEGASEVRVPVWGKFSAVAFVDYGNVWSQAWDFDFGDLRYAVGPGLRYLTPIGPARVDLGYQLNPIDNLLVNGEPQKRQWRLHFSIGQAF